MSVKRVFLVALFSILGLTLAACNDNDGDGISSISIDESSLQTEYLVDAFDLSDIKIVVLDGGGTSKTISANTGMISADDYEKLSQAGTHEITIMYEGLSTNVTVTLRQSDLSTTLYAIYQTGVNANHIENLSYEEWLEGIQGADGVGIDDVHVNEQGELIVTFSNGDVNNVGVVAARDIELRHHEGNIQWRYKHESSWINLMSFSELTEGQSITIESLDLNSNGDVMVTYSDGTTENIGQFLKIHTVRFFDYHGYLFDVQFVFEGQSVNPLTPLDYPGYDFVGWDKPLDNITDSLVVNPIYEVKGIHISFDTGTDQIIDDVLIPDGEAVGQLPIPTKDGFEFAGWYFEPEHMTKVYADTEIMVDSTLYARWQEKDTVLDVFPDDTDIEITLWHAYGSHNMELLQVIFDEFEAIYPNVTINHVAQGNDESLRSAMLQALATGTAPTMTFGTSEHFLEYHAGDRILALDDFIHHEEFGVDLYDFVPGFLAQNQQYLDGKQYSLPFAKSTDVVFYNKTVFDHYGIGFNPDEPITWDDLNALVSEYDLIGEGDWQAEFLLSVDSPANFFINNASQWNIPYTNNHGDILFDNADTEQMLSFYKAQMDSNVLTFPIEWNEGFSSSRFGNGDVLMTQGSTLSTRFNLPRDFNGRFGLFEVGMMPMVQYDLNHKSALHQGQDMAIMADTTLEERLAAWLLMRHMTNTENSAYFARETHLLPVRQSSFETDAFQAFLDISHYTEQELIDAGRFDDLDLRPFALATRAAYAQLEYFTIEPAFTGPLTSSRVRQEVGFMIEDLYVYRDVSKALQGALDRLN